MKVSEGSVAGAINVGMALAMGAALPQTKPIAAALLVGLIGYGVSLALFVLGLRYPLKWPRRFGLAIAGTPPSDFLRSARCEETREEGAGPSDGGRRPTSCPCGDDGDGAAWQPDASLREPGRGLLGRLLYLPLFALVLEPALGIEPRTC